MRGMGNISEMMKQAQKMQEKLQKMQDELKNIIVEASAGGGAVTVTANAAKQIISVKIEKELAASGDIEMLQDLVTAAVNEALSKAQESADAEAKKITGSLGLNIPGMF
ncbi:MAG TPA: YbaB/EbfC family nucleoid-associated protein [Candidatus Goldiibacteriota bacterium]|nr:YbaB/EbfC family nucleoid-associated protein [Candidatus Goldiibacteriota bacterium]